jgi:hypothetical protein
MPRDKSLGEISDELHLDREKIRSVSKQLKELEKAYAEKVEKALQRMQDDGVQRVTGAHATMSLSVNTVPNIEDWDKFYRYVKKNDAFHLLERRPAAKAWREEVENRRGKLVPGTKGFEKVTLLLRNQ